MAITTGMMRCLGDMIKAEQEGRYEDSEIVCDGLWCWLGERRVHRKTVRALLRLVAISEQSDSGGVQRFVINGVGRSIKDDPKMADSIAVAIMRGGGFSIVDGKIVPLPSQD